MVDIRRPEALRFLPLALAGCIAILAVMAAPAGAATICVNKSDVTCNTTFASGQLQTALDQAASNSGEDTILVGPGTETNPGTGFDYNNQTVGNEVHLIGSGSSQTILTWADTNGITDGLLFSASPGSTVSGLGVLIPANELTSDYGLVLGNDVDADHIAVTGPSADNVKGVYTFGGEIRNSTIDLPEGTAGNIGIDQSNNPTAVVNSSVHATYAVRHSSSGPSTTVTGSRLSGTYGAIADNGGFVIRNTLITLDSATGATGVGIFNDNNANNDFMTASLDGVTIVGDGVSSSTSGIRAQANATSETADLDVHNTVITGTTNSLKLIADAGNTVTADIEYSAFDKVAVNQAPGTGFINYTQGAGNVDLTGPPGFATPGGPDFVPLASSPLVDTGDPADPTPGATDVLGNPRACHGTAAGIIRRDIGAFEYKTNPADDCIYPDTSITSGPEPYPARYTSKTLDFGIASDKSPSTFRCWVDDGPEAPCGATYTTPDTLGVGYHTFGARATDQYGNVDQTPVTQSFGLDIHGPGPPTCATDKSLCPPEGDTTPPKVLKLIAPKKTKKKRVKVRFKSNEAKVIFTCKLNKKKAKRCKSPWKTPKLKKGKNVVRVWATDQAGNRSGIKKRVIRRKK